MPGALVAVELVRLPGLGEGLVQLGHLIRRRVGIVRAEQAEQRAGQVLGQVRDRADLERQALRRPPDDERAVAVDRRVQRQAARGKEGLAAAGAVADRARLAVGGGHGPQVGDRARDVADQPVVRHPALGPRRRRRVVRAGPGRLAVVQVRADGQVAVRGELPGDLLAALVVPGHVMDHDHAAVGARAERPGEVGLDLVAAMSSDADGLGQHRVFHACPIVGPPPGPGRARASPSCQPAPAVPVPPGKGARGPRAGPVRDCHHDLHRGR